MLTNTTAQNALSTEFVWSWLCNEFWADKVFVPEQARELQRGRRSKEAFQFAVLDSTRACITMAELTARVWQTRVKPAAGAARMSGDAWQQGQPTSNAAVYNSSNSANAVAFSGPVKVFYIPVTSATVSATNGDLATAAAVGLLG